jgi:ABC-type Na+ transport system ATPase subunit NatA
MALDLAPSDGEVRLSNKRTGSSDLLRTKVTMVPQAVPRWQGTLLGHLQQQAAFYGFTDEQDNEEEVAAAVDLLGLESHLDMRWDELSGGYRTRSAIAAALVARPGLLVLDEPLAMLDPRAQQNLLRALRDRADYGTTAIVVSSQHVPEIESIADVMIALTPGEEQAEIRWPAMAPASTGHLFELGVRGPDRELRPRLRELEEHGDVGGCVPGVRSAVVWFEREQTILGAIEALEGPGPKGSPPSELEVYHVRDLTDSMVARQYADITKERPRIGAGDPGSGATAVTSGAPPRGEPT